MKNGIALVIVLDPAVELFSPSIGNCHACGCPTEGNFAIHEHGFDIGNEVPLCDACGGFPFPTLDDVWQMIAARRHLREN